MINPYLIFPKRGGAHVSVLAHKVRRIRRNFFRNGHAVLIMESGERIRTTQSVSESQRRVDAIKRALAKDLAQRLETPNKVMDRFLSPLITLQPGENVEGIGK